MSLIKYNPGLSPLFEPFEDLFGVFDALDPMHLPRPSINKPRANIENHDDKHIIEQICECYGIQNPELKCIINLHDEEKSFAADYHKHALKGENYQNLNESFTFFH